MSIVQPAEIVKEYSVCILGGPLTDNLNTHTPASLYEAFPPAEVRGIDVRRRLSMGLH